MIFPISSANISTAIFWIAFRIDNLTTEFKNSLYLGLLSVDKCNFLNNLGDLRRATSQRVAGRFLGDAIGTNILFKT